MPDVEPFPTPKPERLLRQILTIATNPGDLVLDSFAGSGTTGAVAHKMGRRWIMVELGEHCHTHIIPRLKKVIDGEDPGGITEAVGWKGGGGFRYYRLAPSLLEKDKWGNWVISKEYNAAMLAEALCKLEGFTYAPSDIVYWQHGHSTERDFIYVTTQHLSHEQLAATERRGGPERTLLVLCTAFRGRGRSLSEPDREEDSQGSAGPLRVGPRRLQPAGREPAESAARSRGQQDRSSRRRRRPDEPPRQRHRRPPEPSPAAAPIRWKSSTASPRSFRPRKARTCEAALAAIRSEFPSVTDFEREFPSLCFALATGVGKTRLMGAFISYLHLAHGINNFFVLAPNLTIYNKLITDFTPNTPKYVFKGIAEFATDAAGDHHRRQLRRRWRARSSTGSLRCKVNIFNISKINSEVRGGKSPRIKRLSEYIGESYFDYLAGLDDLVLLMDESHRYRAVGRRAGDQRTEADPRPGTDGHAVRGNEPRTRCRSRTSSTTTRSARRWPTAS